MSVNGRCNGFDDLQSYAQVKTNAYLHDESSSFAYPAENPGIFCQAPDFLLIILSQPETSEGIFLFANMINFDYCGKDRETIPRVERHIEVVTIDARNFLYLEMEF